MSEKNVRYSLTATGLIHTEARRGVRGRFHVVGDFKNKGAAASQAKRYILGA